MNSVTGIFAVPLQRNLVAEALRGEAVSPGEATVKPLDAEPAVKRPIVQTQAAADVQPLNDESPQVGEYTAEEQAQIDDLKARDAEVRAHEQAHKAVGGRYAGAISYEYQTGPDGNRYAVGGSVPFDVAQESTPEATIKKMDIVIAAALAPVEPSSADRTVAANARTTKNSAQAELITERREQQIETLGLGQKRPANEITAEATNGYATIEGAFAGNDSEPTERTY